MDALSAAAASAAHPDDPQSASIISVLAIDTLMPSLRLAHHYVLTILAQRYPRWVLKMHRFRDETYLLLAALLEAHSLGRRDASFAEFFYGMRRVPSGHAAARVSRASAAAQFLALLLPAYLRAKLDAHLAEADSDSSNNNVEVPAAGNAAGASQESSARDSEADEFADAAEAASTSQAAATGGGRARAAGMPASMAARVAALCAKLPPNVRAALQLVCRTLCAACDGGNLLALLLFVHGRSRHATLAQWLLGFTLRRRMLNDDATDGSVGRGSAPRLPAIGVDNGVSLSRGGDSADGLWRLLHRLGALAEAPLRHARQLLLLSVFSFRLLEWWHAPQHLPPPPPRLIPPPPRPPPELTPGGFPSHLAGLCGACRIVPRDPTAAPSGYVYCAACARSAARRDARCPVTGTPMHESELRRLYETSRPPQA